MPVLVNPMDALKSFEPALRSGEINVQPGEIDPTIGVHLDRPNGEPRFTYARFRNGALAAIAIISLAEPFEGLPCFQMGYAVPQHLRKRGLAKDIARAAIAEFTAGMNRNGITAFYIEAVVGQKNIGSQKVANTIWGEPVKDGLDEHSGEPILQYLMKIGK